MHSLHIFPTVLKDTPSNSGTVGTHARKMTLQLHEFGKPDYNIKNAHFVNAACSIVVFILTFPCVVLKAVYGDCH